MPHLRSSAPALAVAMLACIGAATAQAQEATPQQWQFYLTPYLWISGVSGTLKTRNPNIPEQEAEAGFGDILSHLNSIPIMGAAELRYGRFGLLTDIIAVSVKSDIAKNGVLFSGGGAKLTQVFGSAFGAYRVIDGARQSLDLGIGVRAFGISTKFSVGSGRLPGFSTSPSVSWADPIAGLRYHADFGADWGLTAYGDVGGGPDSSFTWQAVATVDYRLSRSTVLRAGYRHLQFEYEGSRLHQNMRMSGPIIGTTIQF